MTTIAKPNSGLMDRVVATIGELPTSPAVVSSVMGMTADLNTDVDQLSRVLSADQALTAKVLRLSNSPFYGRSKAVASLSEAVLILGFYTIRSLVVATATHSLFKKKDESAVETTLWEHSLACALACRLIAKRLCMPQNEELFISGLLHDIGKLILAQKLPDQYNEVVSAATEEKKGFIHLENDILGFNHADLGAVILQSWNFPPHLTEAIKCHHDPDREEIPDGGRPIAPMLNVADALVYTLGHGFYQDEETDLAGLASAEALGLDSEQIVEISGTLAETYAEEKRLFEE